ncbi:MAG TPA: hypothetical protein VHU90_08990 [Galbitalea sp.]|nr:hypothetical protein [Galbitalea sp.]
MARSLRRCRPRWKPGDKVILNGWGIGGTRNGGLADRAVVDGEWLVALPDAISAERAAAIGTAGFTAALSVLALGNTDGEILVTGASGGVGSIAIALLAKLGRTVIASTGSPKHRDYLLGLGAADTIDRAELEAPGRRQRSAHHRHAVHPLRRHARRDQLGRVSTTETRGGLGTAGT